MSVSTIVFDFGNVLGFFSHRRAAEQLAAYSDAAPEAIQAYLFGGKLEEDFECGRMSAEVIRVLAAELPWDDRFYPTTLFAAEEAYAGACTARSTIYTASIAAGLMVSQMTKWLRRLPTDPDLTLNLLAAELTALDRVHSIEA